MIIEWEKWLLIIVSAITGVVAFFLKRHIKNVDVWISKQQDLEKEMIRIADNLVKVQEQMQKSLESQSEIFKMRVDNVQTIMIDIKTTLQEQQKILQHMDKNAAVTNATLERFIKLEERILALEKEKKLA